MSKSGYVPVIGVVFKYWMNARIEKVSETILRWKPVPVKKSVAVSQELKRALQRRFKGGVSEVRLDQSHISFLEGLYIAGIRDADSLIRAIENHNIIELNEVLL